MPVTELTTPAKTYWNSSSTYYCPVCNAQLGMSSIPNGGRRDCKCGAHVYKHYEEKKGVFSTEKIAYTSTWVETDARGKIIRFLIR